MMTKLNSDRATISLRPVRSASLARVQGRVLTAFQNRRFDSDFLALKQVIQSGELGLFLQ